MSSIRTIKRQTLSDISLRYYGSMEKAFTLFADNADVVHQIDSEIAPGTIIKIRDAEVVNPNVVKYYADRKLNIATKIPLSLVGPDGDYNDDYSNDYNIN